MNKFAILSLIAFLLVGCGSSRQNIYYWDGEYQNSVYEYLNEEGSLNKQISNLQNSLLRIKLSNKKIPPGFYAHLGLLHNANGDMAVAKECFQKEAELFPQSTQYMQFLLNDKKGSKK